MIRSKRQFKATIIPRKIISIFNMKQKYLTI
jgi:hypothetical protein